MCGGTPSKEGVRVIVGGAESVGSGAMAIHHSHHTPQDEARDRERAPRPRIPVIPALLGTVALLNVTSVVFALIG